jgi:hypothetical protein
VIARTSFGRTGHESTPVVFGVVALDDVDLDLLPDVLSAAHSFETAPAAGEVDALLRKVDVQLIF